jgi:hypothetical protein
VRIHPKPYAPPVRVHSFTDAIALGWRPFLQSVLALALVAMMAAHRHGLW